MLEFSRSIIIIENRSIGSSIIDSLLKLCSIDRIDPYSRIFNWVVNDKDIMPKRYKEMMDRSPMDRYKVIPEHRKYFGFATSGSGRTSRKTLYSDVFNTSIKYTADTVRDDKLIHQLSSLVFKNGRIDHDDGELMIWL